MDYTTTPLVFKVKKAMRYVRMYGPARTRAKVEGQYHMKRQYTQLPAQKGGATAQHTVGLIGCGNYAYSNIAYYLSQAGQVIRACMDVDATRAASLAERYGVPSYSADADVVLGDPAVNLVYIASNHATHAEYAIEAIKRGKHVYIEKPHVVTEDQLNRLVDAMLTHEARVFLGFNRPGSRFGQLILEHLGNQTGSGMYNWFVAGHAIDPEHWYFAPAEGGRVLGNLCHWTDFVFQMVNAGDPTASKAFPVMINPTRARKADADIAVTYTFPDETVAAITFSAKGHTFEGVREHLSAHRGNCLISMDDYESMVIEEREKKTRFRNVYRDHGHKRNILRAYESVTQLLPYDRNATLRHVANTAWLFLKTREALEANTPMLVEAYPGLSR